MEKTLRYTLIFLLFIGITGFGCSDKSADKPVPATIEEATETVEKEKGSIEEWTEKTGKEVVEKLQSPIDDAKDLQEKADDKLDEMKKQLDSM